MLGTPAILLLRSVELTPRNQGSRPRIFKKAPVPVSSESLGIQEEGETCLPSQDATLTFHARIPFFTCVARLSGPAPFSCFKKNSHTQRQKKKLLHQHKTLKQALRESKRESQSLTGVLKGRGGKGERRYGALIFFSGAKCSHLFLKILPG